MRSSCHQICPRPPVNQADLLDISPTRSSLNCSSITNFTIESTDKYIAVPQRIPETPGMFSLDDMAADYNFAPENDLMLYNFLDDEDDKPVGTPRRESEEERIVGELAETMMQEEKFQHISDLISEAQIFKAHPDMAAYPVEQTELPAMFHQPENTDILDLDSYRYVPEMAYDLHNVNPTLAPGQFDDYNNIASEEPVPSTSTPTEVKVEGDDEFPVVIEKFNSPSTKKMKSTKKSSKTPRKSKTVSKVKRKASATPKEPELEVEVKDGETYSQAIRRVKNNEASRNHRSKKRNNLQYLMMREEELLTDNAVIAKKLGNLDQIAKILKEGLVQHGRNRRLPE